MLEPKDFLAFAQRLVAEPAQDASSDNKQVNQRTSINRAYYATFHIIKRYLVIHCKKEAPGEAVHSWLIRELRSKHSGRMGLINKLEQMRGDRERADYDLNWGDYALSTAVQTTLTSAKTLISEWGRN